MALKQAAGMYVKASATSGVTKGWTVATGTMVNMTSTGLPAGEDIVIWGTLTGTHHHYYHIISCFLSLCRRRYECSNLHNNCDDLPDDGSSEEGPGLGKLLEKLTLVNFGITKRDLLIFKNSKFLNGEKNMGLKDKENNRKIFLLLL